MLLYKINSYFFAIICTLSCLTIKAGEGAMGNILKNVKEYCMDPKNNLMVYTTTKDPNDLFFTTLNPSLDLVKNKIYNSIFKVPTPTPITSIALLNNQLFVGTSHGKCNIYNISTKTQPPTLIQKQSFDICKSSSYTQIKIHSHPKNHNEILCECINTENKTNSFFHVLRKHGLNWLKQENGYQHPLTVAAHNIFYSMNNKIGYITKDNQTIQLFTAQDTPGKLIPLDDGTIYIPLESDKEVFYVVKYNKTNPYNTERISCIVNGKEGCLTLNCNNADHIIQNNNRIFFKFNDSKKIIEYSYLENRFTDKFPKGDDIALYANRKHKKYIVYNNNKKVLSIPFNKQLTYNEEIKAITFFYNYLTVAFESSLLFYQFNKNDFRRLFFSPIQEIKAKQPELIGNIKHTPLRPIDTSATLFLKVGRTSILALILGVLIFKFLPHITDLFNYNYETNTL